MEEGPPETVAAAAAGEGAGFSVQVAAIAAT